MTIFRDTKSRHEKLEVLFQIFFLMQVYNSFTEAKLFHRVFADHLCQYQRLSISQDSVQGLLLKIHDDDDDDDDDDELFLWCG